MNAIAPCVVLNMKLYEGGSFCILSVYNVGGCVYDLYHIVSQLVSFEVLSRRYRVRSCVHILNIVMSGSFEFPVGSAGF